MHKFLFYSEFIIFLYMFRALLCSKHVEESLLSTCAPDGHLQSVMIPDAVYNTIFPPDDEHSSARNM